MRTLQTMLTPDQYYDKTLTAQGLKPVRQLEKIAAARGIDIETAKIAQHFWHKLNEDGLSYGSPQTHAEDSMKLAGHYAAYVKAHKKTAAMKADALATALKLAAVKIMQELKIADVSPEDALAAGALQADAQQQHDDALPIKRDALIGGDGAVHPGASDALMAAGTDVPADISKEDFLALIQGVLAQHPEWAQRDMGEMPGPGAEPLMAQENLA